MTIPWQDGTQTWFGILSENTKNQALRFMLVGVLNTAIDFAVFFALVEGFGVAIVPANVLAFATAVINSFFLNKYWSFAGRTSSRPNTIQLPLFVAVNLVGMVLSTGILWWLAGFFPVWLAKVLATVASFIWNFVASRQLVFRLDSPTKK